MTAQKQHRAGGFVLTGNHLYGGHVIYLGRDSRVTRSLSEAAVFVAAEDAEQAFTRTRAAEQTVGAYAAEVTYGDEGIIPVSLKEQIRQKGPSLALPAARQRRR